MGCHVSHGIYFFPLNPVLVICFSLYFLTIIQFGNGVEVIGTLVILFLMCRPGFIFVLTTSTSVCLRKSVTRFNFSFH